MVKKVREARKKQAARTAHLERRINVYAAKGKRTLTESARKGRTFITAQERKGKRVIGALRGKARRLTHKAAKIARVVRE